MKTLFDLLPVIIFFIVYKLFNIYAATASAIIVTFCQLIFCFFKYKKIDKLLLTNFIIIFFLGGLTIFFKNNTFIMWKPTAIYWIMATILLFSNIVLKKNLIKTMMEKQIKLNNKIWTRINLNTVIFLILLGCLNLFVAFKFNENTWVNFKLFGTTGLMIAFMIYLSLMISKEKK
ncbi:MAG: septation protein A [Nitrosomonadales bacterium]|jgi:intracellular septation protein